ncbi:hypothetical protein MLD38_038151 [Melastoma candidum]|uniref:Uncharacterized protein n=1 Tax=Melastoma candidum TaxID=119954 RepID=A0ACB9KYB1_9MYRT|nr:hypothetical protein MLD38_038151 [Melastoma candidum]
MDERQQAKSKCCAASFFRVPLHYPKYRRQDYMTMPEWKLDGLLKEYGLSTSGDLSSKQEFAMGMFLWPDADEGQTKEATTPLGNPSGISKKIKAITQGQVPGA